MRLRQLQGHMLKLAHEDSPAATVHRPKLGRPSKTSTPSSASNSTETPLDRFPEPPPPPSSFPSVDKSKQSLTGRTNDANQSRENHETSNSVVGAPASAQGGGSINDSATPASGRPVRTTRNPRPVYVDAIQWSNKPWQASDEEIEALNKSIYTNPNTSYLNNLLS